MWCFLTSEASSARLRGVSDPFSFIEAMVQVYDEYDFIENLKDSSNLHVYVYVPGKRSWS